MSWDTLTVGRLVLRENYDLSHQVNATTGVQSVSITGLESTPPWTEAQLHARQEDLISLLDQAVPVIFGSKDNHTGFYSVSDTGSALTKWPEAEYFGWNLSLERIGTDGAIDMESHLASTVRQNDFSLTGERWHAPAVGHYGYYAGSSALTTMTRAVSGSITNMTVYRSLPANTNPVWGVTAENYLVGRVQVQVSSQERSGVGIRVDPTFWSLSNGLVTIIPFNGHGVKIQSWDGVATSSQTVAFTANGSVLNTFVGWDGATVTRNDFECCIVRLVGGITGGRVMLDLTLRRGSRVVEGFMQCNLSGTMGVKTSSSVFTTNNASTGYIVAAGDDAQGNRFTLGSARTFTGNTTGAISKSASTSFGFYAGHVIHGATAVSGDAATDLRDQYIGSLAEQVLAVKR